MVHDLKVLKYFLKFLFENDIPTGKASFFSDPESAYSFLDNCEYPIVLKADGLAAGKGVLVSKKQLKKQKSGLIQ